MKISNKTYDVIKWIVTIVLPAIITLYSALASIWGFPYAEQIVPTLAAIEVFLGVIMGISTHNYNKTCDGMLHVDMSDEAKDNYLFEVDDLDGITDKDRITLKIKDHTNEERTDQ